MDGQSEILNRCLETYLRCFSSSHPRTWSKYLVWAELWYNTTYHKSLQMTPFLVVYCRDPPPLHRFEAGYTTNFELQNSLQERNMMLVQLKHNLSRAQDIMKNQADKSRGDVELEVGSMVYLKLRLYRQKSVEKHLFQKLAAKVFGPYKVLENIEKSAYRLELPPEPHIHHVFHISQIKQALGHHDQCIELPPVCLGDALLDFEPEEVLDKCYSAIVDLELLVKWTQNDELETSWLLYREFVE